jgi:hypothetical protein
VQKLHAGDDEKVLPDTVLSTCRISTSRDDLEQLLPTQWTEHCVVESVLLKTFVAVLLFVCLDPLKHVLIGSGSPPLGLRQSGCGTTFCSGRACQANISLSHPKKMRELIMSCMIVGSRLCPCATGRIRC